MQALDIWEADCAWIADQAPAGEPLFLPSSQWAGSYWLTFAGTLNIHLIATVAVAVALLVAVVLAVAVQLTVVLAVALLLTVALAVAVLLTVVLAVALLLTVALAVPLALLLTQVLALVGALLTLQRVSSCCQQQWSAVPKI